jgi:hypothetical protein
MPFTNAPGTFTGTTSEWLISHTTFSDDVINNGVIGVSGIVVISSTFTNGRLIDGGTLIGGIHIDSSSKIVASNTTIVVEGPSTFGGGIRNAGILSAGHTTSTSSKSRPSRGGITNSGLLTASTGDGIAVSSSVGVFASGTAGRRYRQQRNDQCGLAGHFRRRPRQRHRRHDCNLLRGRDQECRHDLRRQ